MATLVHDPRLPVAYVNGHIIPTGKKPVTGVQLMDAMSDALQREYDGQDPKKIGMTRYDAMMDEMSRLAADGNLEAARFIADRTMGKPIQQVNTLSVTTDLKSFLSSIHLPPVDKPQPEVDIFAD